MYHLIYKTVRPSTGEYYIGKHSTEYLDDGYQGSGRRIKSVLRKERCVTEILQYCTTEKEAYEVEKSIVTLSLLNDPLCLNLVVGGRGCSGGESHPMFGAPREANPMFGRTHSEEARRKMSEVNIGNVHSTETRRKMGESRKGENNPKFKGYYHTPTGCYTTTRNAGTGNGCSYMTIQKRTKNQNFPDYWFEPADK